MLQGRNQLNLWRKLRVPRTGGQVKRGVAQEDIRDKEWRFCYQCDGKPSKCFHRRKDMT